MHSQDLAEYIGGESCFVLEADVANIPPRPARNNHRRSRMEAAAEAEKVYPPPMARFPSVMKKHSTSGGRVVVVEEKLKLQRYMRAHRSGDRLLIDVHVEEFDDCPEKMDGGDDGVTDDVDPTVVEEEEESGANNPTCDGLAPVATFGPPVLT